MDEILFSMPFLKIDQSRRVVTGVATADNIDPAMDLVEAGASQEAFDNWVGNIREMHAPKAVGKSVGWKRVRVPYHGTMYDGVEVEAYISKGSEDTWQKVLDGTLTGFSIGGRVVDASDYFDKSQNRTVRKIKKYELHELSLVDNPGNPAAQISMVKRAEDGTCYYDLIHKYTVFYCPTHHLIRIDEPCCDSGDTMYDIGHVDEIDLDVVDKMVKSFDLTTAMTSVCANMIHDGLNNTNISTRPGDSNNQLDRQVDVVHKNYINQNVKQKETQYPVGDSDIADGISGGNMESLLDNITNDNVVAMTEELSDQQKVGLISKFISWLSPASDDAPSASDGDHRSTSTSPQINIYTGIGGNTPEITKAVDGGGDDMQEEVLDLTKSEDESAVSDDAATDSEGSEGNGEVVSDDANGGEEVDIEKLTEAFGALLDEKLSIIKQEVAESIETKMEGIQKSVDEKLADVSGRVEQVESTGAIKKSIDESGEDDIDSAEEVIAKSAQSFWGGLFVGPEICKVLGYES